MATSTFGTTAQTSMTGLKFLPGYNSGMAAADIATIQNLIRADGNPAHPMVSGGHFSADGLLFIPGGRGVLKMKPGDWVAVDSQGWPILVSANSIASSNWVHNP
jgi:hypothetical protein